MGGKISCHPKGFREMHFVTFCRCVTYGLILVPRQSFGARNGAGRRRIVQTRPWRCNLTMNKQDHDELARAFAIHAEPPPLRVAEGNVVRVGNSRVRLDLIVAQYENGMTAEDLARAYDTLELADVHADLGSRACWLRVPEINYSWVIFGDARSVAQIQRIEELFSELLPKVRSVRVDELLRVDWERSIGMSWEKADDPIGSLQFWLVSTNQDHAYFRVLAVIA